MKLSKLTLLLLLLALTGLLAACGSGDDDKAQTATTPVEAADPNPEAEQATNWSYSGDTGPANWAKLDPEYKECGAGRSQSPINLTGAESNELPPIEFLYDSAATVSQQDNGHAVESKVEKGSSVKHKGTEYDLIQFHLHSPSEHRIDGKSSRMELHMVHESAKGEKLVVAALIDEGEPNEAWDMLTAELPRKEGEAIEITDLPLPGLLIPNTGTSQYYSYSGSLTTPPCTEPVQFLIFSKQVPLEPDQVAAFNSVHFENNRPLQPRNGRELLLGS